MLGEFLKSLDFSEPQSEKGFSASSGIMIYSRMHTHENMQVESGADHAAAGLEGFNLWSFNQSDQCHSF